MSNLKSDMAEKYPYKSLKMKTDNNDDIDEQREEEREEEKKCAVYKILKQSIVLGILFVILSIPETYRLVGDAVNNITSQEMETTSSVDKNLIFLHGLVFSVVCFVFLYMHEKLYKQN